MPLIPMGWGGGASDPRSRDLGFEIRTGYLLVGSDLNKPALSEGMPGTDLGTDYAIVLYKSSQSPLLRNNSTKTTTTTTTTSSTTTTTTTTPRTKKRKKKKEKKEKRVNREKK